MGEDRGALKEGNLRKIPELFFARREINGEKVRQKPISAGKPS